MIYRIILFYYIHQSSCKIYRNVHVICVLILFFRNLTAHYSLVNRYQLLFKGHIIKEKQRDKFLCNVNGRIMIPKCFREIHDINNRSTDLYSLTDMVHPQTVYLYTSCLRSRLWTYLPHSIGLSTWKAISYCSIRRSIGQSVAIALEPPVRGPGSVTHA